MATCSKAGIVILSASLKRFREKLISWFENHQRSLPWRETENPYHIWVSEVMLQQTQVKKVVDYYRRFLQKFPTLERLAESDLQELLKMWEGLGYYARARNLRKAAKIVVSDMDGEVPTDYKTFRKLPGVGDYTAAAVQSIAFGHVHAAVDGNVKRVIARMFMLDSPVNDIKFQSLFQEKASFLLDRDQPGTFNQAMMELGAMICRPKAPLCTICPVNLFCTAFQAACQDQFPLSLKRQPIPSYHLVVAVIRRDEKILIVQRPTDGLLGGLWEFPCGEIDNVEELPKDVCCRIIQDSFNLQIEVTDFLTQIKHAYTHFKTTMDIFECRYLSGEIVLEQMQDYRWIKSDQIDQYPLIGANHKFLSLV